MTMHASRELGALLFPPVKSLELSLPGLCREATVLEALRSLPEVCRAFCTQLDGRQGAVLLHSVLQPLFETKVSLVGRQHTVLW